MAQLTKTEAKALLQVGGRSKYTDDVKDEALRWLIANAEKGKTMKDAAEQYGMSVQTLSSHRKRRLEEAGLVEASE